MHFPIADFNTVIGNILGGFDSITVIGVDLSTANPADVFILREIVGTPGDDNYNNASPVNGTTENDVLGWCNLEV